MADDPIQVERPLGEGPCFVVVWNRYEDDTVISGTCRFYYKYIVGELKCTIPHTDNLLDAAVPAGSPLVFQSERDKCVSRFEFEVFKNKPGKPNKKRMAGGGDVPNNEGNCWLYAIYSVSAPKN
jgi:hypothetical protein